MDVRSQVSMVLHLDKCIGCHTCSVACKSTWTDRQGAEYMWWNNVETKPGTGYPTRWEDQDAYRGGWDLKDGALQLRSTSRRGFLPGIFHHKTQPGMDEYYEPWTYHYAELFDARDGDDQPTAQPLSEITGRAADIEAGPNWDGDLGGSTIYAANDPNLGVLGDEERAQLQAVERLIHFHLPRICNHCLNPACVAACPSGSIYKRGEDGIVLIDQETCRAWRSCTAACPYKKTYFNWHAGKSEKCILCYPRIEAGQAPACFHACVGRIRYLGVLLYDAERIEDVAALPPTEMIAAQRSLILDPHDEEVVREARENGVHDEVIRSARRSPVYRFVKEWGIALPPHVEYRTLPMLFYVPPMLPVMARRTDDKVEGVSDSLFPTVEQARIPLGYLANLLGGGDVDTVAYALRKQMAARMHRRAVTVGDVDPETVERMLREADCSPGEADRIFELTALSTAEERFVIPPAHREEALAMAQVPPGGHSR